MKRENIQTDQKIETDVKERALTPEQIVQKDKEVSKKVFEVRDSFKKPLNKA